jgi:endonuclease/exonuclease/phosphatase family metal-dependent hydrolase
VLQEISRGWLIAGGLDVAEWLSRRLQMPYVYAPGHDYQFGNIIFTRRPIKDWSFTRLPLHNVPLGRGLIRAEIDLGDGKSIDVINTHLSAYATSDDRIPQVQKLLEVWNRAPRTVIAGDMNAHPEDSDIALFLQAGLVSAQDATNNGDLLTYSSAVPVERIDWIFGSPDVRFGDFVIPQTTASDHLPLAVNVRVP